MADKEYIERVEAILAVTRDGCTANVVGTLFHMPAADVVEVRNGEWKLEHETYGKMRCSACGKECLTERKPDPYEDYQMTEFYVTSPFCPNCGAKMDGERKEQT